MMTELIGAFYIYLFLRFVDFMCLNVFFLRVCIYATFVSDTQRSGDGVGSPMLHLATLKLSETL